MIRADSETVVGRARHQAAEIAANLQAGLRDGARPHHLIKGGPGMGKSRLLRSVLTGIDGIDELALVLRPSPWGVGTYADLLFEALYSVSPDLARAAGRDRSATFELEECIATLAAGRAIVLVVDDIDRHFAVLDRGAQGSFRAWVETSANVSVLAAAQLMTDPLHSRSWPWFGSFNITTLEPLSRGDAADLAGVPAGARTGFPDLYDRLGGSPRVWAVAAALRINWDGADPADLSAQIADGLTPWLLPRVLTVSSLSARLLVALARRAEPSTVTMLANDIAVTNQNAAVALGRLAVAGWVTSHKSATGGDRRSSFYTFTDPAMGTFLRLRGPQACAVRTPAKLHG